MLLNISSLALSSSGLKQALESSVENMNCNERCRTAALVAGELRMMSENGGLQFRSRLTECRARAPGTKRGLGIEAKVGGRLARVQAALTYTFVHRDVPPVARCQNEATIC